MKTYQKITKEDMELMLSLHAAGKTAKEIAEVVGRTEHSVYQFFHNYRKGAFGKVDAPDISHTTVVAAPTPPPNASTSRCKSKTHRRCA